MESVKNSPTHCRRDSAFLFTGDCQPLQSLPHLGRPGHTADVNGAPGRNRPWGPVQGKVPSCQAARYLITGPHPADLRTSGNGPGPAPVSKCQARRYLAFLLQTEKVAGTRR